MSEEVSIHYRLTADEVVRTTRWHLRQSAWRNVRTILCVVFAVLCAVLGAQRYSWSGWSAMTLFDFGGAFYALAVLLLIRPVAAWRAKRNYAKSTSRDLDVTWRIDDEAVRIESANGNSAVPWRAFNKAVQTPDGLLLYPQPILFYWLPRHAFADEADYAATIEMAQRHVSAFRQIT